MVEPWMTREESEEQPSRVEFDGRCVSLMSESMVLSEGIDASRSHFDSPPPTSAGKLGFPERAFSATGAAFLSAILVNPLDVAKEKNGTGSMKFYRPNLDFLEENDNEVDLT